MIKKIKLTGENKKELATLEEKFKHACLQRDIPRAQKYLKKIQDLLRPLGQHVRLSQNKCLYCELLVNTGYEENAIPLLLGLRKLLNANTRIYLEATVLLAISYLRRDNLMAAEPLMSEVLQNDTVIRSDFQRQNFQRIVMNRFNEESVLTTLRQSIGSSELLDPVEIQTQAGCYVYQYNEDELYEKIGENTPKPVKDILLKVERFSQKQLPCQDVKFLPSPERFKQNRETGKVVGTAIKKTLHHALCNPECETHKIFITDGFSGVLKTFTIGSAVSTCFSNLGIGLAALAIPVAAFIFKVGLDTFCELYPVDSIMETRKVRKRNTSNTK